MQIAPLPPIMKMLAHELRWEILQHLSYSDYRVNELVELTKQPTNLVSYHLKQLRETNIVHNRRSDSDGRDVYYCLNLEGLAEEYRRAGALLHPSLGSRDKAQSTRQQRVLFLCTHNSARSQIAEGLMQHHSGATVTAFSAGSHPTRVHPEAIRVMQEKGIDISHHVASHVQDFSGQPFDYVITVCDTAREVCPIFDGVRAIHWGFSDPTQYDDPEKRKAALMDVVNGLERRILHFLQTM